MLIVFRGNVDARFIVSAVGGSGNTLEIIFIVGAVIDLNETGGRDRGDRGRRQGDRPEWTAEVLRGWRPAVPDMGECRAVRDLRGDYLVLSLEVQLRT